jgi:CHASE3 domain sensor protein
VKRQGPFSLLLGVALIAGAVVWWRNRMLAANTRRSPETSNPPVTGLDGLATRPAVTSARPPGSDPL